VSQSVFQDIWTLASRVYPSGYFRALKTIYHDVLTEFSIEQKSPDTLHGHLIAATSVRMFNSWKWCHTYIKAGKR